MKRKVGEQSWAPNFTSTSQVESQCSQESHAPLTTFCVAVEDTCPRRNLQNVRRGKAEIKEKNAWQGAESGSNQGVFCTPQRGRLSVCLSSRISELLLTDCCVFPILPFSKQELLLRAPIPASLLYIEHMCLRRIYLFNS